MLPGSFQCSSSQRPIAYADDAQLVQRSRASTATWSVSREGECPLQIGRLSSPRRNGRVVEDVHLQYLGARHE